MKLRIYTDGGSRGNPGPSAIGFLIIGTDGALLAQHKEYIGEGTNNTAEYRAIITSLKEAKKMGGTEIESFTDSQLACRQLQGAYKVKQPHIRLLFNEVKAEEQSFKKVTYFHLPREDENIQVADALVNEALDERGRKAL